MHATPVSAARGVLAEEAPCQPRLTATVGEPVAVDSRRRVCVWFGRYVIASHIAEPRVAIAYEQAMRRRFPGVRTTNNSALAPGMDNHMEIGGASR